MTKKLNVMYNSFVCFYIYIYIDGRGEKSVQGFGGKARRKETTGKTQA
jgi:hypothetical protein